MTFDRLFEPISIGNVLIKNRVAMAPMGVGNMAAHLHDGALTQQAIEYYTERAYGGTGLIISGVVQINAVEPTLGRHCISRQAVTALSELAEAVHYYGSRLFVQLTAGFGRVFPRYAVESGIVPLSPSSTPSFWRPEVMTKKLTVAQIETIIKALGEAARLLSAAGIDGIELHGHEGYLFDQFATAIWNKRTDKYGGPRLKDRLTFATEVLQRIRDSAGKSMPVVYRYGLKHYLKAPLSGALKGETFAEAGRDVPEGLDMARLLEKAGFDALHVDAGCYDSWYWAHPPNYQSHGCMLDMAAAVKKVVKIPVIAVGRLDVPELAEKAIEEGKADMVAIGRGLLADPHWTQKVREGRIKDIRPCLACHDGCLARLIDTAKPVCCTVNPASGRERSYTLHKVLKSEKLVVAGGGVAGMEAARVAATRGCDVVLYEAGPELGGNAIPASVPPFKKDLRRLLDWYVVQLKKLGVVIRLNTEATVDAIRLERPDKIVVATGATPIIPCLHGIEDPSVSTCVDLLLNKRQAGEKVAVIGGGLVGCETALWLADQGKKVTIVARNDVANGVFHANRTMLLDLLRYRNVVIRTSATIETIGGGRVVISSDEHRQESIGCDTVALAAGLQPRRELHAALRTELCEVYSIGDCKEPLRIMDAIWDGYHVASR